MAEQPLTKLDTAWLHLDEPTNRMVINGFFRFAREPDPERLAEALTKGFEPFRRFRQRVDDRRSFLGRPRWVDDEQFDLANHLERLTLPEPGDVAALQGVIDDLLVLPLDPARPLWKVYVIDAGDEGCLLFFRIHHCIGDGIALLQVLLSMCVSEDAKPSAPRSSVRKPLLWWALLPVTGLVYALHFLWINLWLLIRPKDPESVFRGKLGVPKRTSWADPLPLTEVKALARAAGCKINDILLATVSGAMRRYAEERGQPLVPGCRMRCVVPVNLRPASMAGQLGNYFALVTPTLPVGEVRPRERLQRVKRAMDKLKRNPEGLVVVTTFRLLGLLGVAVQRMIMNLLASKTSMVVTNVPGPQTRLSFADLPIEQIMFWVPMGGALGLGFSIFSYAGNVGIGIMTDEGLVPDPKALSEAINTEFSELQKVFGTADEPAKDEVSLAA